MKAALLRRLDRLQMAATLTSCPPLALHDLTTDPDALAAYWEGTVQDPPDGVPMGQVHGIVIAPTMDAFESYRATVGLDDDGIEELERRRELEDRRRESAEREAAMQAKLATQMAAHPSIHPAPANAYSPVPVDRD